MGESAVAQLPDYRELMVSVGNNSTIRVRKLVYSVPGRLIGAKLLARLYENRIVLLEGAQEVAQLPLVRKESGAVIDFRHVIGHLLRKPGAFAGYRYREALFPTSRFRMAYDALAQVRPTSADREYLALLHLAAKESEQGVDDALRVLLGAGPPSVADVTALVRSGRALPPATAITVGPIDLGHYDALLSRAEGC